MKNRKTPPRPPGSVPPREGGSRLKRVLENRRKPVDAPAVLTPPPETVPEPALASATEVSTLAMEAMAPSSPTSPTDQPAEMSAAEPIASAPPVELVAEDPVSTIVPYAEPAVPAPAAEAPAPEVPPAAPAPVAIAALVASKPAESASVLRQQAPEQPAGDILVVLWQLQVEMMEQYWRAMSSAVSTWMQILTGGIFRGQPGRTR